VGYPVADTIGGMTAAFAVAVTLADRARTQPTFLDVSMLEATMATMGWAVSNYLVADRAPQPMGNDNVTASPSGTFRTKSGLINIAANKQEQFQAVCRVVGMPQWVEDPRFVDRHARLQNRDVLKKELDEALSHRTTEEWWSLFNAAGIPAGPVYTVAEALEHPQVADRGMLATYENVPGVGRDVRLVRTGFKVNGQAPSVAAPPPMLGEHTDSILAELGFEAAERQAFKVGKVV
jgi:formyl-CoA transferase